MAIYYCATNGDDGAAGGITTPWKTINHSLEHLAAGDTLNIRGGTYYEQMWVYNDGSAGNIITIQAYGSEKVIVNGEYVLPAAEGGDPVLEDPESDRFMRNGSLVLFLAGYNTVKNIEFRNSLGRGLTIDTHNYITLDGCTIRSTRGAGIVGWDADYLTVTNCEFTDTGNFAPYDRSPFVTDWPGGISLRRCDHFTCTHNTVHHIWGEGILPMDCDYGTIADNVVYDCYALQIYLDRSTHIDILRNIVYSTNTAPYLRSGNPACGIVFADEDSVSDMRCSDITIINNLVYGTESGIQWWGGHWAESGVINCIIAHNTIAQCTHNSATEATGISIDEGAHANSVVRNNVIYMPAHTLGFMLDTGVTWDHNVWSSLPDASVRGTHDVNSDPKLLLSGSVAAGLLARGYFVPRSDSPAIGAGVAQTEVPNDYDGRAWGTPPDCGAFGCYPVVRPKMRR